MSTIIVTLHIIDRFVTGYSVKNIPIPSKHQYKIQLISKTEEVIERMTWKYIEFLEKRNSNNIESYGFINACWHQSKLLLKNLKRNDSMDWKNIKETCREVFLYFC